MQCSDPSCTLNVEKMIETRIHTARELRKNLGLPSASTNAYRLVNSEGDRYRPQVLSPRLIHYAFHICNRVTMHRFPSLNTLGKSLPTDPSNCLFLCEYEF